MASDATINGIPVCRVCGIHEVELHHWAPRALFGDDADLWPMDFLCRECHSRWHTAVTPTLGGSACPQSA